MEPTNNDPETRTMNRGAVYGNFDIILGRPPTQVSISTPPYTPCTVIYLMPMLVVC